MYWVDYCDETEQQIAEAIEVIKKGVCKRVDVNKFIKVYDCGGVIRIDLKKEEVK